MTFLVSSRSLFVLRQSTMMTAHLPHHKIGTVQRPVSTIVTSQQGLRFNIPVTREYSGSMAGHCWIDHHNNNNSSNNSNNNCQKPTPTTIFRGQQQQQQLRSHYTYSSPGTFQGSHDHDHHDHPTGDERNFLHRGYTVGIGGPVGSGKTALVLALTKWLKQEGNTTSSSSSLPPVGVVTNDIFTQEDAEFLIRHDALPRHLIRAVETGGCPHAAIREDVSANLTACEELTTILVQQEQEQLGREGGVRAPLILCESGGDNLAANFSSELADLTIYVIDVAGGDKVPRKGGPGITQSDLLLINKIDLAELVGADLSIMERDAHTMRRIRRPSNNNKNNSTTTNDMNLEEEEEHDHGPTIFASVRLGTSMKDIQQFILDNYNKATQQQPPK